METRHLQAVEKWTLILAALLVGISMIFFSRKIAFSLSMGAGLMALNAYSLRRIGQRAFRTFQKPGAAVLLFNLKMAVLIGIIYVMVRYLHVEPLSFIIGISIFPLAILAVGLSHTLSATPDEETHG